MQALQTQQAQALEGIKRMEAAMLQQGAISILTQLLEADEEVDEELLDE